MRLSAGRALLAGGLTVGTLDLLDAVVFFGLRSGATPTGILHSIAAGLVGRQAAAAGGASTAALGLVLHYLIAFLIVGTYHLASRRFRVLVDRAVACGLAYGVAAYAVMNYVVIPLSATTRGAFSWPVFLNGIAIHLVGVGLPSALSARAARD